MYGDVLGRPLHLLADALRSFIWASPDHKLIGGDFASIEGRITAWYGRDEWKLQAYRDLDAGVGKGIYETTAAGIYGIPVDSVNKAQRQVGKVAELACVAEGTLVLTHNGAKAIEEVSLDDLLWDGVEWVKHQGLVDRGIRETINVCGIEATPDHLFLVGTKWQKANHIALSKNILYRALATGSENLPYLGLNGLNKGRAFKTSFVSNALVKRTRILLTPTICAKGRLLAALNALENLRGSGEKVSINTPMRAQMTTIGVDFLTGYPLVKTGATTRTMPDTLIMGVEVLKSMNRGSTIKPRFYGTSFNLRVGINLVSNWIALTLTKVTNPTILDLLLEKLTSITAGRFKNYNAESLNLRHVYDIAHVGPRNRFTIITPSGCLISHNCGFGGGVGALSRMARSNRLDLATVYPSLWGITEKDKREQAVERYEQNKERGDSTANELSREAYVAAELVKSAWRIKHPGTVQAWRSLMEAAFTATNNPGVTVHAVGVPHARYLVAHGFLWLQLPSGRCLAYGMPEIRPVEVPWADKNQEPAKREKQPAVTVRGVGANSAWTRYPLNISICYNNLVQATARDLLVHAMHNVEKNGYPIRMHVHDEIVSECPNSFGSVEDYERLMSEAPNWADGLPLAASGFTLKRYAKT